LHTVTGKTATDAKKQLESQGFKCSYTCESTDIIVEQIPKAGTPLVDGSTVQLYSESTRKNKTKTTVPDLKGMSYSAAKVSLSSRNLNINVVNAPNNEEIKPVIEVKESTGEYTKLETDTILVQTNSIEGIVYDDNNEEVPNIELSLYKDGNEVKRTYTNKNGKFVYSDLETGNYNVRVEEDIYDLYGDSSSSESNDNLILRIKEVDKFNIETHKYITNLNNFQLIELDYSMFLKLYCNLVIQLTHCLLH